MWAVEDDVAVSRIGSAENLHSFCILGIIVDTVETEYLDIYC